MRKSNVLFIIGYWTQRSCCLQHITTLRSALFHFSCTVFTLAHDSLVMLHSNIKGTTEYTLGAR